MIGVRGAVQGMGLIPVEAGGSQEVLTPWGGKLGILHRTVCPALTDATDFCIKTCACAHIHVK